MATELVDLAVHLDWRPTIVAAELRGDLLRFSTGAEISLKPVGGEVHVEAYVAKGAQASRFIWRSDVHVASTANVGIQGVTHTGDGVETLLTRHDGVMIPILTRGLFQPENEGVRGPLSISYRLVGIVVPGFGEIDAPPLSLRMCDLKPGEKTWI